MFLGHWLLDWISHRPDMPLTPWPGTKVGLSLWNSVPATIAVEGDLFAFGVAVYVGNVFGPPPPGVVALHAVAFAGFLIPVWAGWFDRHRGVRARD